MPGTLAWQLQSPADLCQSGKMAGLLNSLFFVFKISVLPKYRFKYYDSGAVGYNVIGMYRWIMPKF